MKFAFIAREKATFPIDLLCAVLGASRAGFYAGAGIETRQWTMGDPGAMLETTERDRKQRVA